MEIKIHVYIKTEIVQQKKKDSFSFNLTKVRPPLFMLSHRGSDNSPLLIVFSANYIDLINCYFLRLKVG